MQFRVILESNSKKLNYGSEHLVESTKERDFLYEMARTLMKPFREKVFDLVTAFQEELAQHKIGPKNIRIGVFGPYPAEGRMVIEWIAKRLSELGFAPITGMGYYLPNDPNELHDISELNPPVIREIFTVGATTRFQYYYLFPRLVSKAVFYMNDERGQTHELRGCYESFIPFVGFIIHNEISKGEQDCGYLVNKNGYFECVVPDVALCSGLMPKRPFCPFHDSIDLCFLSQELFLKRRRKYRENRLVAVTNLPNLETMLRSCVLEHE